MTPHTRRIVTGHDNKGKSVILYDDSGTNVVDIWSWPGGLRVVDLWVTEESPACADGDEDRALRPFVHEPTSGGTIFRRVEIPPESTGDFDPSALFEEMDSRPRPSAKTAERHFSMHRTDSVDYVVVVSGEMWMLMDEGKVLLRPGDCIVQRGTTHAWVNTGVEPCVLVAVLISAVRPCGIGS